MDRTGRVVQQARRRITAAVLIDGAGRGLAWGAAAGLVIVCAGKLVAMPWPWWSGAIAATLVGGAVGALLSLRYRRTMLDAAGEVDRRLRLKDRLSTATAFAPSASMAAGGAFRALAVADADAASAGIDPRRAVPLIWGRAWHVWPVLLAVAVGVGLWAPALDLMGEARRHEAEQAKARDAVARSLAKAAAPSEPEPKSANPASPAQSRAENTVLQDIERELASGKIDPATAAEKGARELEKIAAERERTASADEKSHEALRDTIAKMNAPQSNPASAESSKLGDALRSGDLGEAAQAAREMMNSGPEQTSESRAKAAAELQRLAKELREADKARREAQTPSDGERAERDGKRSEKAEHHAGEGRREKQPAETEPSQAARPGDKNSAESQSKLNERDSTSEAEQLATAMERAAEDLRDQPKQQPSHAESSKPSAQPQRPDVGEKSPSSERKPSSDPARPQGEKKASEPTNQQGKNDLSVGETQDAKDGSPQTGEKQPPSQQSGGRSTPPEAGKTAEPGAERGEKGESQRNQSGEKSAGEQSDSRDSKEQGTPASEKRESTGKPAAAKTGEKQSREPRSGEKSADKSSNTEKPQGAAGEKSDPNAASKSEPTPEDTRDPNAQQEKPSGRPAQPSSQSEANPDSTKKPSGEPKSTSEPSASPNKDRNSAAKPDPGEQPSNSPPKQAKPQPGEQLDPKSQQNPAGEKTAPSASPPDPDGKAPSGQQPDATSKPQPSTRTDPKQSRSKQPGDQPSPSPDGGVPKPEEKGSPQSSGKDPSSAQKDASPHSDKPDQPGQSGDRLRQLADRLDQLSKQPQSAGEARKQADDFRKQAQEMLKNATPEQREQMKRWAQNAAKNRPPQQGNKPSDPESDQSSPTGDIPGIQPQSSSKSQDTQGNTFGPGASGKHRDATPAATSRTTPVDARPPTPTERREKSRERVIAEWYADKKPDRGEPASAPLTADAERTVRDAVKDGEHALETEAVPSRYDKLLRRYFQRLGDRAKSPQDSAAAPATAPRPSQPAVPAQDAGSAAPFKP